MCQRNAFVYGPSPTAGQTEESVERMILSGGTGEPMGIDLSVQAAGRDGPRTRGDYFKVFPMRYSGRYPIVESISPCENVLCR
jgi:hypothetical protein